MDNRNAKGIQVWVVFRADRGVYTLRWNDPITRRRKQQISTATNRRDAYKEAGKLADELERNEGQLAGQSKLRPTWDAFCERYKTSYLIHTSATNQAKWRKIASEVDDEFKERRIALPMLADITAEFIESVYARMRESGNKPATAKSKLDTLQSGLNWAHQLELLEKPVSTRRAIGRETVEDSEMHGRPLTGEEVERMLAQVSIHKLLSKHAAGWHHLIRGLYLSGLRISEAMNLHESDRRFHMPVGLDSRRPVIKFRSTQKNRRDQTVALTPDFAAFLRNTTPVNGWYFNPCGKKGRYKTSGGVSDRLCEFGRLARIVVVSGDTPEETQTATAHDLRRSFARRWAAKVMPPFLQHLMRHQSIETTMKYYVGSSADSAANAIYDGWKRSQPTEGAEVLCDQVCDQLDSGWSES